jgi:hypothetical protein
MSSWKTTPIRRFREDEVKIAKIVCKRVYNVLNWWYNVDVRTKWIEVQFREASFLYG